jgi:hypothetical protein
MLRRAALVRIDVSEELSASIIRIPRIGELGTLGVTNNPRSVSVLVTLTMEAILSSETPVLTRAREPNVLEYGILHSHRHENLTSYIELTGLNL